MELRAPRRPPAPIRKVRRNDSDETLKTIIISLLIVVAIFALYINATANKTPTVSAVKPVAEQPSDRAPTMVPQARPVESVVTYQPRVEPQPTRPSNENIRRYNSMQEYCYRMRRMNSTGEYPALQQAACNDYAKFAQSIGLDPGQLPDVLVQSTERSAPQQQAKAAKATESNAAACQALETEKQSINAATRQLLSAQMTEYYREQMRQVNAQMWNLNCRNH